MNGLMTRYKESLSKIPKPILFSEIKGKMDYRGLLAYAKFQGKRFQILLKQRRKSFTLSNSYITISLRQLSTSLQGAQGSNAGIFRLNYMQKLKFLCYNKTEVRVCLN